MYQHKIAKHVWHVVLANVKTLILSMIHATLLRISLVMQDIMFNFAMRTEDTIGRGITTKTGVSFSK